MWINKITNYFVEIGENADPTNIIEIPPRALSIDKGIFYFEDVHGQIEKSRIGLEIYHLEGKPYRLVNKATLEDILEVRHIRKRQLDNQLMNSLSSSNTRKRVKMDTANNHVTNVVSALSPRPSMMGNKLTTAFSALSIRHKPPKKKPNTKTRTRKKKGKSKTR
jgi:hypothetical protein